jgi:hypothetical protein
MRNQRTTWAITRALILIFSTTLSAQTPAAADNLAAWGPYARLAGQTRYDTAPEGRFSIRWRWETPGEALVVEWHRGKNLDKLAGTAVLRLGTEPRTIHMKGNFMMGKEWVGTLNDDGSVSYVGKGLLKMRFTASVDEQGNYTETYSNGYVARYAPATSSAEPATLAQTAPPAEPQPSSVPPSAPAPTPAPVVASPPPAPVVAKLPAPPAKPIKAPRRLTQKEQEQIWLAVQNSRAQSLQAARKLELQRQEAARQAAIQEQIWAAERARQEAEEAAADAEFEAERQQKAAAWNAMARANEQALNDSMQRLRDTTARIQAQQAQAQASQNTPVDPIGAAERRRQVELINQANRRQDDIAAAYAQRQQSEPARAAAPPSGSAGNSRPPSFDAGRASTDTDANRCVTRPEIRQNDTSKGNTAAYITNGCGTKVDVRICLMTDKGWNCGVSWGVAPQASWSWSSFNATGPVFVDAKVTGSSGKLASPN